MNIRLEKKDDYTQVEELTREAFWNLYVPGCDEHYLCHILREHKDFISELDYVVELDGKIVASIMYTRSYLIRGYSGDMILFFRKTVSCPRNPRKVDKTNAMYNDNVYIKRSVWNDTNSNIFDGSAAS